VFVTGPLGIVGVAGALLVLNRPFGVALLGVIALMGMISQRRDPDRPDRSDRAAGIPAWDAIVNRRCSGAAYRAHRGGSRAGDDSLSRSVFWDRWPWRSWAAHRGGGAHAAGALPCTRPGSA
jgi:hypothetical protein